MMLWYKFLEGLDGHPTLYADQYSVKQRQQIVRSPFRGILWEASLDGDKAATAALIDWYQEQGIYEKRD